MTKSCLKIMLLLLLCMAGRQASADAYDPLLLRAQASIFPKIVLLDQSLAEKTHDDEITITIVYSDQDILVAKQLKRSIEDKYGDRLGNKKMTVNIATFNNFSEEVTATAYIVLQGTESLFKKVVSYASQHGRIVFSYDYADFENDALISMHVKEKTYIYINKSTLQSYGINFLPVFYKIAKIVE